LIGLKKEIKAKADEAIGELYCEVAHDIESDSWTNFRNDMVNGFMDYPNAKSSARYDFKTLRRKMFNDYKSEIVKDISDDILEENKSQKKIIERMQEERRVR